MPKPEVVKTTIALDRPTWEALKILAVREGRPFRALVLEAVKEYLKRRTK